MSRRCAYLWNSKTIVKNMSKNDDLEYGHGLNKYLAETHECRRRSAVRTLTG